MNRKEFHYLLNHVRNTWSPPRVPLDNKANRELLKEAFSALLALSVDLDPHLSVKQFQKWLTSLSKNCFSDIMEDCKLLTRYCISISDRPATISAFKGRPWKTEIRSTFLPIWRKIEKMIFSGECVGDVYQWAKFLQKLPIDNPDLDDESLEKWLSIEDHLKEPTASPTDREIYYFSRPFRKVPDRSLFRPTHSGGRVAEKGLSTYFDKYTFSRPIPPLYGIHSDDWTFPIVRKGTTLTSRLCFVPKTVFARRAIAMEPAGLMWYQQGWKRSIYHLIESESFGSIHFSDQRYNQRLCRTGSATGEYATIDFSSASDTLKLTVVSKLLRDAHPLWKAIFLKGRSSSCELPDKTAIQLQKYAPMGSTFTFPLETLFFYSVAAPLMEQEYGTFPAAPEIAIFGDDCIVPISIADRFMKRTEEFGFLPNREKTFSSGPFRESCGCDVFDGEVITPLLYRVPSSIGELRSCRNMSVIAACNHAWLRGYSHLREFLISLATHGTPFTDDIDNFNAIFSERPYTTKCRTSPNTQMMQYLGYQDREWGGRRCAFASERHLQEWLRMRAYTDPDYMPDLLTALPPTQSDVWTWLNY